jgi:hypothetical protein
VLHNLFLSITAHGRKDICDERHYQLFLPRLFFSARHASNAQSLPLLDKADNQWWNDFQVTVPMTKHFDFTTRITMRFGKNVSRLNDGRYLVGLVWKPTPSLSFSPYFWYIRARNATGRFRTENRLSLAVTYKFPFKAVGLTHRSVFEYRERRPISTWRYRAYLTAEKELPEKLIPKRNSTSVTRFFMIQRRTGSHEIGLRSAS